MKNMRSLSFFVVSFCVILGNTMRADALAFDVKPLLQPVLSSEAEVEKVPMDKAEVLESDVEALLNVLLSPLLLPETEIQKVTMDEEERTRIHAQIAQILVRFVDMKDKKNSLFYFKEILPLIEQLTPPFTQDEALLKDLVDYLNSPARKKHMNFTSYWDKMNNTAYWANEVVTVSILKKAMRLIVRLLNQDAVTKTLAPNKKTWTSEDVNLALILTSKSAYKE